MNKNIVTRDFTKLTKESMVVYLFLDKLMKPDGIISYNDMNTFEEMMKDLMDIPESDVLKSLVELEESKYFIHFDDSNSRNFGFLVREEEVRREFLPMRV